MRKVSEVLTEATIYFIVVFSPWAFGTTEEWAVSIMNLAGYFLGLLWLVKWVSRWRLGPTPRRTRKADQSNELDLAAQKNFSTPLPLALACLTIVLLAYCAVGALNARAIYHGSELGFEFRDYLAWLPASYDRLRTWKAFENYLALAFVFWATRDWLLAQRTGASSPHHNERSKSLLLPSRLRRLLWVLALNGALLAMEGILQRLEGSDRLLWLVQPTYNRTAESQFGPYAYRSNAAQYFNLVWPVCLGFWWALHRTARTESSNRSPFFQRARIVLLPAAIIMAACPIISTSRGGAIVAVVEMSLVIGVFFFCYRGSDWRPKLTIIILFICTLATAGYWGWGALKPRLERVLSDNLGGRGEIYENARRMATDFPVFGSGPGTFASIYQLYRTSPEQEWAAQVHNDWLETRITFGWVGSSLIALALMSVFLRWFFPGAIEVSWRLPIFFWIALAGCLLHAVADFPLQIYSILLLFVLFCAILFCLSSKE